MKLTNSQYVMDINFWQCRIAGEPQSTKYFISGGLTSMANCRPKPAEPIVAVSIVGHFKYEHCCCAILSGILAGSLTLHVLCRRSYSDHLPAPSSEWTPHHRDFCQRLLSCCMLISVRVRRIYATIL